MDLSPGPISIPLLVAKLEILVLSWAISNALAHLIFTFAWERFVVLD
jgi:hypothetical protein